MSVDECYKTINNCPICQSKVKAQYSSLEYSYYIRCRNCGLQSPYRYNRDDAIELWNNLKYTGKRYE